MDLFKKGWFSEQSEGWPGLVQSYEVDNVIDHQKSKYQDVIVFKAKKTGLTMALDGVIQTTELDEFAYHEMMSHIVLYCHPNPKRVLIIGGGDLGVAREVLKHKCVELVDLCDIDEKVTELSKKYLPHLTEEASKDPRLHVMFQDGAAYIASKPNYYDIIITDSSDPIGPAESLFNENYYKGVLKALRPGGIICSQGESMWLDMNIILRLRDIMKSVGFPYVEYSVIQIPTYPGGSIGCMVASTAGSCKTPLREMTPEEASTMKYYSKAIHEASFVLPEFFRKKFEE
ncbi:spermidine synthase [Histomonas meleagridis]|uniref:spermidine synthase n=1 Tax=Histomonas meleagridis TaxID=135588 RepID=UPI00355971EA|nr:spermidine synthase [Histomonas meleagridis]KAH0796772.1 spermidine synthase [Histomonas meleagridis]